MTGEVIISSVAVYCLPNRFDAAIRQTQALDGVSVPHHDNNAKFVAVIETERTAETIEIVNAIAAIDGVVASNLVYQQTELKTSIDQEC